MEYTFIMIKPDGVRKGLVREITERIDKAGLQIVKFDVRKLEGNTIDEHYSHLVEKHFYPSLKSFMSSDYVVPMIVYGENAISAMRSMMGPTKSAEAPKGTIRGDFGDKEIVTYNIIHGSDSPESANIEIKRFFNIDIPELEQEMENRKVKYISR
ncbi:MAG TPA: nucleoside-diphosphate kinase [Tenericutes bacterium]|nr:nucleoside-diphosphate kinase [Mycoplasmatota bacterium]